MKTIEVSKPGSSEQAIREGQSEDVLVLRDGRPVALVVPFDQEDLEWYERERNPAFIKSIAHARKQVRSGKAIGHDELKTELGL